MPGPFAGIRVLDFTEYIAGPYCGMMLADMGADVVKVEPPEGDRWRHTAPLGPNESRGFLGLNRGKRSVSLDLRRSEARPVTERLLRSADVMITSYRPAVLERLRIDYESVRAVNPRIIYAQNTAFGQHGPYSHRGGYDLLSQAATGMMLYENKAVEGVPSSITATAVSDLSTGMFMAFAVAAALFARQSTGKGQKIETSLFASGLAAQYRPLLYAERFDKETHEAFRLALQAMRRDGRTYREQAEMRAQFIPSRGQNNYYRVFETKDGLVAVACLNNRQRRRLRDLLGMDDPMVEGDAYDWTNPELRDRHADLTPSMEEAFRSRTTAEWLAALDAADVPCGPVNFPEEMYDDPHVVANGLMLTLEHPVVGTVRQPACPVRMSESETGVHRPSPVLGADGPAVLRELGYSDAEIESLVRSGALHRAPQLEGSG